MLLTKPVVSSIVKIVAGTVGRPLSAFLGLIEMHFTPSMELKVAGLKRVKPS